MESVSIGDGLILTVVAIVLVFIVLAALWGFIELVHKVLGDEPEETPKAVAPAPATAPASNSELQTVAEIMAVIAAHEEDPKNDYDIVETKRIC